VSSITPLNGLWQLEDETGKYNLPFELPGDGVSALLSNKVIDDPYFGQNEYDSRWICERDWIAKRIVNVAQTDLDVILSQVDTIAEIRVNGQLVLSTQNAFRTYRQNISKALKIGDNEFEIRFKSVVKYANDQQAKQPYFVPHMAEMCPIENGNMVRKPQCDFGWDWNIALAPFGIYGEMHLVPTTMLQVGDLSVEQIHKNKQVQLKISLPVKNFQDTGSAPTITIASQTLAASYDRTDQTLVADVIIDNPNLWWPSGQGEQTLYDLDVQIGDHKLNKKIGLCDIKLISEPDDIGRSFGFEVNGRPVFAKGANWIPADALAGRIDRDNVKGLLQSAIDANMNMIRIWGGGRYEPDWFYDLCDELGLMVWHDLMFSCNLYPATDEFLSEIEGEVAEAVSRINYHACIAVWCGDNELIGALGWFDESKKDRDTYLVAYDRLNRVIEAQVKRMAPNANWWPSSPSPGPMSFGDAWHDDSSGDMHFWSVWHEGKDFDHYRDVSPRFCSEFGFQSYPSMNIIRTFANEEDFNIAAPVMESHQKNTGGNARIAETMFRYFRFPNNFENFVYLSQVQQGLAIKTAVTHWRSVRPTCMGALVWQLNDTWPVCSWSSLDYGGGWKLLHHMEKHFFAPLFISAVPKDDHLELALINDNPNAVPTEINVFALSMSGETRNLTTFKSTAKALSSHSVCKIARSDIHNDEVLVYEWTNENGDHVRDHWAPRPYKNYKLPNPNITFTSQPSDKGYDISITADAPAFFVAMEADIAGRFSDNAFLLLAGETKTISFNPVSDDKGPEFTLRDLRNATL
jgi:beta-mannosidase